MPAVVSHTIFTYRVTGLCCPRTADMWPGQPWGGACHGAGALPERVRRGGAIILGCIVEFVR